MRLLRLSPSEIVDRYRRWLPVMQGLEQIDPLDLKAIPSAHRDFEILHHQTETISFPLQVHGWDLPQDLSVLLGPIPGRCSTLLLRSRPWKLSCQHSQVIDSANHLLHDPTTSWEGVHGRSWPLLDPRRLDGTVLCLSDHGTPNLYHWLFNPTLQLLRMMEASCVETSGVTALYLGPSCAGPWPDYVEQTLRTLGLGHLPRLRRAVRPRSLLWSVQAATGCWPSQLQWQWLRDRLRPETSSRGRRLYLGRAGASRRRLVNERALMAALNARGFECIEDPSSLPFAEQCRRFAEAEMIVAPHGAALSLLFCCHPRTRVLEIHSPTYLSPLYAAMAHYGSMDYHPLMAIPVPDDNHASMDDILVDINQVLTRLSFWGVH